MTKTILYVHSSDEMYGADKILLQLVNHLPKDQFRPIILIPTDVPYDGLLTKALQEHNIEHHHYPTAVLRRKYFTLFGILKYSWMFLATVWTIFKLIKQEKVDIVHSNTAAVIPGAIAALLARKPHIWHIHEIIMSPKFLWKGTSWLVPRLSKHVVAVSTPTLQHLIDGNELNRQKGRVIFNGIETERFDNASRDNVRREWGIGDEEVLVGMIGRFSHWKGQDHFVKAAKLVSEKATNVKFAIVGGTFHGQEYLVTEIETQIANAGLTERVIISGFRSDIPSVLSAYDIFVLPSTLPDPFPTVLLEAMAVGRPVIANAHGGSTEMVQDGVTGILVDPTAAEKMAAAIAQLVESEQQRSSFGQAGQKRLESVYSLAAFTNHWLDLYKKSTDYVDHK